MNKKIIYVILLALIIVALIVLISLINDDAKNSASTNSLSTTDTTNVTQNYPQYQSMNLQPGEDGIIDIKEKMFIGQMNDIFINFDNYKGKMIRLQGFIYTYTDETTGQKYYHVMRRSPGCCGNDGVVAIQIIWDEENPDYPQENEWVEVVGVLESIEVPIGESPVLKVKQLTVMQERGQEFVTQ